MRIAVIGLVTEWVLLTLQRLVLLTQPYQAVLNGLLNYGSLHIFALRIIPHDRFRYTCNFEYVLDAHSRDYRILGCILK